MNVYWQFGVIKGPIPRADQIREKSVAHQEKFVTESRRHIGTDE